MLLKEYLPLTQEKLKPSARMFTWISLKGVAFGSSQMNFLYVLVFTDSLLTKFTLTSFQLVFLTLVSNYFSWDSLRFSVSYLLCFMLPLHEFNSKLLRFKIKPCNLPNGTGLERNGTKYLYWSTAVIKRRSKLLNAGWNVFLGMM